MARRNKLWRFAQLQTYANYFEAPINGPNAGHDVIGCSGKKEDMRGRWAKDHFGNDNPITLELACGRGEYTVALAQAHPNRNFIGVDIKGARIFLGATELKEAGVTNAAFLRTRIESIDHFFGIGEVSEIWITFPDPFHGSENRRLTAPRFWINYARMLPEGGRIHLKTDDPDLYEYSREQSSSLTHFKQVADFPDIYGEKELPHPELIHKTYYERKNIAKSPTIHWLSWERNGEPAPDAYMVKEPEEVKDEEGA